jgi:hypothetical protein
MPQTLGIVASHVLNQRVVISVTSYTLPSIQDWRKVWYMVTTNL